MLSCGPLPGQSARERVAGQYLVLLLGPGSREAGRVQPGAETDLEAHGAYGRAQSYWPGTGWPPPGMTTDGHGPLQAQAWLGPALGCAPLSSHSSPPAAERGAAPATLTGHTQPWGGHPGAALQPRTPQEPCAWAGRRRGCQGDSQPTPWG